MSDLNYNSTNNKPYSRGGNVFVNINASGTINDLSTSSSNNIHIGTGGNVTLNGVRPEYDGQEVTIFFYVSGRTLRVYHNAASNQAYGFDLEYNGRTDVALTYGDSITIKYNNILDRWVVIGTTA
jgi:hypothetical protein